MDAKSESNPTLHIYRYLTRHRAADNIDKNFSFIITIQKVIETNANNSSHTRYLFTWCNPTAGSLSQTFVGGLFRITTLSIALYVLLNTCTSALYLAIVTSITKIPMFSPYTLKKSL